MRKICAHPDPGKLESELNVMSHDTMTKKSGIEVNGAQVDKICARLWSEGLDEVSDTKSEKRIMQNDCMKFTVWANEQEVNVVHSGASEYFIQQLKIKFPGVRF